MLKLYLVLVLFGAARGALAPFIKPCAPNDSTCIVSSAQQVVPYMAAGIPELNVPSLDPMRLDLISSDEGGLQLTFKNTTVVGMKNCVIENIKLDTVKGKQVVLLRCSVVLTGNYILGGKLLILPITGQGTYSIRIRDIIIKSNVDFSPVTGQDNKPHWHITNWKHSFNVKTNVKFQFNNLFGGNKLLADPILQFANNNWREVMKEIAPPVVHAIVERVVNAVEALYKAVPIDELSL